MTSSQTADTNYTTNNTITDTTMEEATSTSPTHILSHSEIEITPHPIETSTNKGKSPETQTATQTNPPKI
ncbi:hypothetical protein RhiirC2_779292 [Rhizophagus irregularis]|uniref:Uncharacterized protein n=1 Tax=Rhizophagus irregularis TaxID=588596 RepID=A0A2N1NA51_9GLOM|nr:hypothetical protein RhiirC2_779292 [Rhizophagus irregularis]